MLMVAVPALADQRPAEPVKLASLQLDAESGRPSPRATARAASPADVDVEAAALRRLLQAAAARAQATRPAPGAQALLEIVSPTGSLTDEVSRALLELRARPSSTLRPVAR